MASKGQKFNNYSDELRNEIISKYISGIPSSRLEKEYNIPQKLLEIGKENILVTLNYILD